MGRAANWGYAFASHVGWGAASRAAAWGAASYRRRNAGSCAQAASRARSTRRSNAIGLWRVRLHSGGSIARNTARAGRLQLQERLVAMAHRPVMRSGSGGLVAGDDVMGAAK